MDSNHVRGPASVAPHLTRPAKRQKSEAKGWEAMAGSTISGTITSTVTIGSALYPSPLTISGTGVIAVAAYAGIGVDGPADSGTLINDGAVTGGAGSAASSGGGGGTGVYLLDGNTATNAGAISGGAGVPARLSAATAAWASIWRPAPA